VWILLEEEEEIPSSLSNPLSFTWRPLPQPKDIPKRPSLCQVREKAGPFTLSWLCTALRRPAHFSGVQSQASVGCSMLDFLGKRCQ
jgi:hypothetical protein